MLCLDKFGAQCFLAELFTLMSTRCTRGVHDFLSKRQSVYISSEPFGHVAYIQKSENERLARTHYAAKRMPGSTRSDDGTNELLVQECLETAPENLRRSGPARSGAIRTRI